MRAVIDNWLQRHQSRINLWLHACGIPLLVWGLVLGAVQLMQSRWDLWWRPVGLITVSYLLQWIGHLAEGNDMGEMVLIKRLMGKPYVAVAPRYAGEHSK